MHPRKTFFLLTTSAIYLLYLAFILSAHTAPNDYVTFMEIGQRFLQGEPVYIINSYYPMPYVLIFSFFSVLPSEISIILWLTLPVLVALIISDWNPAILLFAPLFAHFAGGQSAFFGLLGLWGYRRYSEDVRGGLWLALTTIKPQMAIVPVIWATAQWVKQGWSQRQLPRQALVFCATVVAIYAPTLLLSPNWPAQWLANARPLFGRALTGIVPRSLLFIYNDSHILFWLLLAVIALTLLFVLRRKWTFDRFILAGFIISPLLHDYDLIQLIPLLDSSQRRKVAIVLALPLWLVVLTTYASDTGWFVATLIPAGLLLWDLIKGDHDLIGIEPQAPVSNLQPPISNL